MRFFWFDFRFFHVYLICSAELGTRNLAQKEPKMASAAITKTQVDWVAVSRIVSAKTGHRYAANYCSEVARGRRKSAKLEAALAELGVMKESQELVAA